MCTKEPATFTAGFVLLQPHLIARLPSQCVTEDSNIGDSVSGGVCTRQICFLVRVQCQSLLPVSLQFHLVCETPLEG